MEYTVCPDIGTPGFSLDTTPTTDNTADVGTRCVLDHINIEGWLVNVNDIANPLINPWLIFFQAEVDPALWPDLKSAVTVANVSVFSMEQQSAFPFAVINPDLIDPT